MGVDTPKIYYFFPKLGTEWSIIDAKKQFYMHRVSLEEKLSVQNVYSKKDCSLPLQADRTLHRTEGRSISEMRGSSGLAFSRPSGSEHRTGLQFRFVIQDLLDQPGPHKDGVFWPGP